MFDLFRSREKSVKILLGAVLLVVAVSMITYLVPNTDLTGGGTTTDESVLADVGGEKITSLQAQSAVDRLVQSGQMPAATAQVYLPQLVDQMVQERAAIRQFEKQGLSVSDDEVLARFMQAFPQLFQNGKLVSTDLLTQQLASQGMSLEGGLAEMRKEILVNKIQNLAFSSAIVTKQEVETALVEKHKTARIEYIGFDTAKFRDQVKPSPEELRQAYDRERNTYTVPAKRSFDVLVVDQTKVEQSVEVSEAQLRAAYAGNMDNFRNPEQVRARHILVMTQGKPDGDKAKLKSKAEDLLKQLKSGADFAELAKKNSDDPGSGAQGGDLGFFTKGKMVKEFETYAFSGKINDISPLIETSFGYHIIQVQEKQPARIRPFDEVKDTIAKQLKQQSVGEKTQQLADQAHSALVKNPKAAEEVSKQLGVQMFSAKEQKPNEAIPGFGTFNELEAVLANMKIGDVSEPIVLPGNRIATATLTGLIPAHPADYADVQDQVKQRYLGAESLRLASAAAQTAGKRALAGEDLAVIAKSYNLPVTTTADVTINDSADGLGPVAVLPEAFAKPVGTRVGPLMVQGRNIVYRIAAQKQVDPNEYTYERDAIYKELKQKKARSTYDLMQDSILAQAKANKDIKIYDDRVRRLAATYAENR